MNNGQDPVMKHTNLDFDTDKKKIMANIIQIKKRITYMHGILYSLKRCTEILLPIDFNSKKIHFFNSTTGYCEKLNALKIKDQINPFR